MTDRAEVRLAPLRWWHLPVVERLEHDLFGPEAWSVEVYWSEMARRDDRYYVAALEAGDPGEPDGRLVGWGGLAAQGVEAFVQTLGVARDRQGRGLGRRLLRELLAEAERRGANAVLLEVRADDPVATGLYASEGFRRIGLRRNYYQRAGADALVLERRR